MTSWPNESPQALPRGASPFGRCGHTLPGRARWGAAPREGAAMARRPRPLLSVLTAGAAVALTAAGLQTGGTAQAAKPAKPTKVVIIVVDALSKEIVEEYDMDNVQALMSDYVDTPTGYLGHTGSVTVVTHNVLTSGPAPQAHGLDHRGLPRRRARPAQRHHGQGRQRRRGPLHHQQLRQGPDLRAAGPLRLPEAGRLPQRHRLGLHVSPKAYAAYGFGGAGRPRSSPSAA